MSNVAISTAVNLTISGIHTPDLLGMTSSVRRFGVVGMSMFRSADGKIAEHWRAHA